MRYNRTCSSVKAEKTASLSFMLSALEFLDDMRLIGFIDIASR